MGSCTSCPDVDPKEDLPGAEPVPASLPEPAAATVTELPESLYTYKISIYDPENSYPDEAPCRITSSFDEGD